MKADSLKRARPMRLAVLGAAIAMVMAACTPPPEEPTDPVDPGDGRISFDSPAVMAVSIDSGTPEEPDVTSLDFTAQASGAWLVADDGVFFVNLDVDPGQLDISAESSPLGVPLSVGYSAVQQGPGVGVFDTTTGEGGFSTDITISLDTLDGGDGPAPIPEPCLADAAFDLTGQIDMETGVLEVAETSFELTPMEAGDCGGLGALIAPMLTDGIPSAALTFEVGTP